jgi:hypothetical protein
MFAPRMSIFTGYCCMIDELSTNNILSAIQVLARRTFVQTYKQTDGIPESTVSYSRDAENV